jgi:hypothetical protein
MTSEQFIKANPTIGFAKALQILEDHGYAFPTFEIEALQSVHTEKRSFLGRFGFSGSGDPAMRETTINTRTLFDWMGY